MLQWHVIGMFAPGFFTGNLIRRFGALPIMGIGVALNLGCIVVALSGVELHQFLVALFLLGVGWNFLFTGSTTLSLSAYGPEEKDRAQGALNFFVFATLAVSSFASGVLVTTQGWPLLNYGSLIPVVADRRGALTRGCGLKTVPSSHCLRRSNTGSRIGLVEDLVVQAFEAMGADHLPWRRRGEGPAAFGVHQPVGARVDQQRGHLPARRVLEHRRATVGNESRQPARDAVVHARDRPCRRRPPPGRAT